MARKPVIVSTNRWPLSATAFLTLVLVTAVAAGPSLTPAQRAVEEVLTRYTDALRKGDLVAAYEELSSGSKRNIALIEFVNTWTDNLTKSRIIDLTVENVTVVPIGRKTFASAIVRRSDSAFSDSTHKDNRLDYHLVLEGKSWRIIRTSEMDERIRKQISLGDTASAKKTAGNCINMDPFQGSDVSEYLSKVEAAPPVRGGTRAQNLDITARVQRKLFDRSKERFVITYSITNNSRYPIDSLMIIWGLVPPGDSDCIWGTEECLIPESERQLLPGDSTTKEVEFPFREFGGRPYVQARLLVSVEGRPYSVAVSDFPLVVPSVLSSIRFDISNKSFERGSTFGPEYDFARIDYRVTNIGNEPVRNVNVKVTWFIPGTSEIVSTSYDDRHLVSPFDFPLQSGESKSSYSGCWPNGVAGRTDVSGVTADVYVSLYTDRYELLYHHISVP